MAIRNSGQRPIRSLNQRASDLYATVEIFYLVGIPLLWHSRAPHLRLVAILDADKKGFLRSYPVILQASHERCFSANDQSPEQRATGTSG